MTTPMRLILFLLTLMVPTTAAPSPSPRIRSIMSKMTLQDKIGQMAQIDLPLLLDVDETTGSRSVSQEKADMFVGQLGVGSVFNAPLNGVQWTATEFRRNVRRIQDAAERYGRPPVIFGLDSVHGANYVRGSIMTPQQINLASTFDPSHAYFAGKLASRDTRAAGVNWLFAPILGVALQPLWSRVYETFGEDPLVASIMGSALIRGIQRYDDGGGVVPSRAAACAKHFVGYSAPLTGHDRSPAWIPERHLHQYFLPSFRAAVDDGDVMTFMSSYSEYDGVPMSSNRRALVEILRGELGFDGMLVTDYRETENLATWHRVAADQNEAVRLALGETSIDMSMVPYDVKEFKERVTNAVEGGGGNVTTITSLTKSQHSPAVPRIPMRRIDESVSRILRLKESLKMFDESISYDLKDGNIAKIGSDDDRKLALDAARASIVLTENDGDTLPISKSGKEKKKINIFVTGPTSDSLRYQSGGWSIDWQGARSDEMFSYGTTVLGALRDDSDSDDSSSSKNNWSVSSTCGVDVTGRSCLPEGGDSIREAMNAAQRADYSVVCLGEESYAEKPGDVRSLDLPSGQLDLMRQVRAATRSNGGRVILVMFGGRPRLLGDAVSNADAVVLGFLPGPDGGRAVVDVLSGAYNPSGRLPITYPKYGDGGGAPYYHAVSSRCTKDTTGGGGPLPHSEYVPCDVQWPFGHGLSYATFEYGDVVTSGTTLTYTPGSEDDPSSSSSSSSSAVTISVTVTNTGEVSGSHSVLFFTYDVSRQVTPEVKRLRSFQIVKNLDPGESRTVEIRITIDDVRYVGPHDDSHEILEDGMTFRVGVGPYADCRGEDDDGTGTGGDDDPATAGASASACTDPITIVAGPGYVGSCDAACRTWKSTGCHEAVGLTPRRCWAMCRAATSTSSSSSSSSVDGGGAGGWGWNYVRCIDEVRYQMMLSSSSAGGGVATGGGGDCWKMTALCRDIFATSPRAAYDTAVFVAGREMDALTVTFSLVSGVIGVSIILFSFVKKSSSGGGRKKLKVTGEGEGSSSIEFSPVSATETVS